MLNQTYAHLQLVDNLNANKSPHVQLNKMTIFDAN